MNKALKRVLLVDDNEDDNFFHERAIKKVIKSLEVVAKESGRAALDYIIEQKEDGLPSLIFLDINMPGMNGWEFLAAYNALGSPLHSKVVIIMLSTSNTWEDQQKAKKWELVTGFITKPLTKEVFEQIITTYFPD